MRTLDEMLAWARERTGYDWSSLPSGVSVSDARPTAVVVLRDILRETQDADRLAVAEEPDAVLLSRLGLVRPDRRTLNRAGALLVTVSATPNLEYLHRPAAGASSDRRLEGGGLGLIEAFRRTLDAISIGSRTLPLPTAPSGARGTVSALPESAAREALVNAVMHRDWDANGPIVVDHHGDELMVFSPGPFLEGITPDTVLTAPSRTRNRVLGGALRSLRLAEQEGTGVDRMTIDLVRIGRPRPHFDERDGGVRLVLNGGDPIPSVLETHNALPQTLRLSARTAVAIDVLRQAPSITAAELAAAAGERPEDVRSFIDSGVDAGLLRATSTPRPGGSRAWRLSDAAREHLGPVLPYYARPRQESVEQIRALAEQHGLVRNGDVQDLLGVTQGRASQLLGSAVEDGAIRLAPGSSSLGRSVTYVPTRPEA